MNSFKYKGFIGSIRPSVEDDCLYGKIEFINDLITYEAETVPELKKAFETAVDDYLETCKSLGKKPEKPFKGSFNVRLGTELQREAALFAHENSMNLNELVTESVKKYIKVQDSREAHQHWHAKKTAKLSGNLHDGGYRRTG
jgi:predicted HicB family RNase H-like nuclease